MYIYNKIIEQPSPPNSHDVLWINYNNSQLYVFLNNKWQSLSFTSNEYKQDKYDIKLKTSRKNITESINELFDIIKQIENKEIDIDTEGLAKQETLLECTAAILQYIEQQRLQLESTAKEETLLGTRSLLDGKFGDVFTKFGELTTFIAQKFDWIANFIVTKKDELQQFISDRKLELHNLIAIDILGAITRNHGELLGKTNDVLGRQQAYENNAVARTQDTINVVNSQGSQLGVHLDDNKWALMGKIDELIGENSEATLTKICGLLTDIKSGVDNIDTISDEQIDELFD